MKYLVSLAFVILFASTGYAARECRDADGKVFDEMQCADGTRDTATATGELPEDAQAQVNELTVKMRYFKAIGFHGQSKEQRDAIASIYQQHNVPLPDEYRE